MQRIRKRQVAFLLRFLAKAFHDRQDFDEAAGEHERLTGTGTLRHTILLSA
jgi:hypothetical protein